MNTTETHAGFKGWAILEIFGHRKLGGLVEVNPPELPGLIRVDVITDGDAPIATQYYGPTAIFCLTPTTEAVARRLACNSAIRPVARFELLDESPVRQLGAHAATGDDDDDESFRYGFDDPDQEDD